MTTAISEAAGGLCIALAIVGCVYTVAATFFVRHFTAADCNARSSWPGVTILKPLAGVTDGLY